MKICPNCKNGVEDDVKLCPNCNTFIAGAPIMSQQEFDKVEKYIEKSNNKKGEKYINRPVVKNSGYSLISFIFSLIAILGILLIPFFYKFSILAVLFGVDLYSSVIAPNLVFIVSSILAVLFGAKHKKIYNYRCTGYILGLIPFVIYTVIIILIITTKIIYNIF